MEFTNMKKNWTNPSIESLSLNDTATIKHRVGQDLLLPFINQTTFPTRPTDPSLPGYTEI
jgi:hypothetical protein